MTHDRHQLNYQNFDQSYVAQPRRRSLLARVFGDRTASVLRSPAVSYFSLFVFGAVTASFVMGAFSGSDTPDEALPVIQAEVQNFKEVPLQRGGAQAPNAESTVFTTMRSAEIQELPQDQDIVEEEVDDLKDFIQEAELKMKEQKVPANLLDPAPEEVAAETASADTPNEEKPNEEKIAATEPAAGDVAKPEPVKTAEVQPEAKPKKKTVENLLAEVMEDDARAEQPEVQFTREKIPPKINVAANGDSVAYQKPAPSNESTIDFVRSVLDRKDSKSLRNSAQGQQFASATRAPEPAPEPSAAAMSNIEPAAGFASGDVRYYVQLSSIRDQGKAPGEWAKLQDTYSSSLTGTAYRVQEAQLDSGTFYRIQAGPFTKENAADVCDQIKVQKPGGCFVVQ